MSQNTDIFIYATYFGGTAGWVTASIAMSHDQRSIMQNLAVGAQTIIIDRVAEAITGVLFSSVPHIEIVLLITIHILLILSGLRVGLALYMQRDRVIDSSEAIQLNALYLISLCFAFVLLRVSLVVVQHISATSPIPFHRYLAFAGIMFAVAVPGITRLVHMQM